jgi:uncharacterized membrane protein
MINLAINAQSGEEKVKMKKPEDIAKHLLNKEWDSLQDLEKRVIEQFIARKAISHDANSDYTKRSSFGDRVADGVASFGGSWTFIILFFIVLFSWILINTVLVFMTPFDPYPFIFLNLVLSMLAAVQAPIIMMSQNRQSAKDRINAEHDYAVNLRAELEIMGLHHKLDDLRESQWMELINLQQKQIEMLERLLIEKR